MFDSGLPKILLASYAIESPPQEGGQVLLSDIFSSIVDDKTFDASVFSSTGKNKNFEKVYWQPGYGRVSKIQFPLGLLRKSHNYHIVHTAHIPTPRNVKIIKDLTFIGRRKRDEICTDHNRLA